MSLDVYNLLDKQMVNCLIKLSDTDMKAIEGAITLLKEKTGIYIDPHGTTRIYPDHGLILLSGIDKSKKFSKNILSFINIINDSIKNNDVLIFEGD